MMVVAIDWIPSRKNLIWFELDAKSGPLEAGDFGENGDFGEIGDFGKNRQRAGNSSDKCPRPLETGNFGENGDCTETETGTFGKNRQKCMQWQKWGTCRKITSLWQFELDATSGPLEADDFGDMAKGWWQLSGPFKVDTCN